MNGGAVHLTQRRSAVSACVAALRDLHTALHQCPNDELGDLAGDLGELHALCGAQLAAVVSEAETRGIVEQSQHASTAAWVADHSWHTRRQASILAKTARLLRRTDLAPIADAVLAVDIDLTTAMAVATEYDNLAPELRDDAKTVVLDQFLTVAADHGPTGVRKLKQEIVARYGEKGEFEGHQERCRRLVELSPGAETSTGVWDYRLTVDNEGRAVLEAAIGPLSAPHIDPETGERDLRSPARRRGEALVEALRRSVSAAQHVPTSPKAVLMLSMSYPELVSEVNAAVVMGPVAAGALIAPDTIRKIACDSGIIPAVLGSDREVLDQGRLQRLFTTGQIRSLWLRDQHCTFGACTTPAAWCDAHHLVHWIDGGRTDVDNAALVCPRHHTIVHRDRLAGFVTATGVSWDQRPGSYRPPDRSSDPPSDLSSEPGYRPSNPPPAGRAVHQRYLL